MQSKLLIQIEIKAFWSTQPWFSIIAKLNEFCNENTEFGVEVAYLEFLIVLNNNFYQFFIDSHNIPYYSN